MRPPPLVVLAVSFCVAAFGCDNREALRKPEPGFERMLQQRRADPYAESALFADGRAMREPPVGTLAREAEHVGEPLIRQGMEHGAYVAEIPLPMTLELLHSGRAAYEDVCATCHGVLGDGNSVVAQKMELRRPPSFFEPRLLALPVGEIFAVAGRGYGLMPGFASTLGVEQRWAVVAYIGALRLSQRSLVADLPAALRSELSREAP